MAVPRIYEKLHTGVLERRARARGPHRAPAVRLGAGGRRAARARAERAGKAARPRSPALRLRVAERVGLAKVRALFGARLKLALVGAAPIDRELLEFFDACGVLVLEGYGMTESCARPRSTRRTRRVFGTVGSALPDSEVMVAEDGEVLLRGPHVFAGYHRDPRGDRRDVRRRMAAHAATSGELSADGYLTLTGRKKDLIITSSGKNVTPVNIENALRETRWISEAVVYGDRRPYLVCMVTLDPDEAPKLAEQLGVPADLQSMAATSSVHAVLQADSRRAPTRASPASSRSSASACSTTISRRPRAS